ncbi:hypothetical protein O4H52_01085 [Sphingomonadaceae bacterium G21617-S1]|nr:hypothetical protein [Sphingomonadaceae bacterium G21617-S1]
MSVKTKGFDEFEAFCGAFPNKLGAMLRGGMRAGGQVIADEAKARCVDDEVAAAIGVGSARINKSEQSVSVRIRVDPKKKGAFKARWIEHGTLPHFISVKEEDKPTATTRHGTRAWSIGQINRSLRRGSLLIDGRFAEAVHHPGAQEKPYLRPALDAAQGEAIAAVAQYVGDRLTKAGFDGPNPFVSEDDE